MADQGFHGALQEDTVVLTREVFHDLVHALLAHRTLSPIWALPGCEQEAVESMEDLVRQTTSELVRRLHGQASASGGDFFEGVAQVALRRLPRAHAVVRCAANGVDAAATVNDKGIRARSVQRGARLPGTAARVVNEHGVKHLAFTAPVRMARLAADDPHAAI